MDERQVRGEVHELEHQVIALANLVESLFAEAVMAVIENNRHAACELREEDYRVHERWIEIDRLCTELLTNGDLDEEQITFLWQAMKIATHLKRAADESMRIGQALRDGEPDGLGAVPRMAQIAQSTLGDALSALASRDPDEAAGVHLTHRELTSLASQAADELVAEMESGQLAPAAGLALADMANRLSHVADEALGIANHVAHLYRAA